MSQDYYNNVPIFCHICQRGTAIGRENTYTDHNGKIIVECVWVCTCCGGVVRNSTRVKEE